MVIRDKCTKNSIKSNNYQKGKTLGGGGRREEGGGRGERMDSINPTLIDWYIVIKPNVACSGRKSTSEKMSIDSIQALTSITSTQTWSS